jgi:hypothetical protein
MIVHNLDTLRTLLEVLARWDVDDHSGVTDAAAMAYSFRDCRLELIRLQSETISDVQLHRLQQMDYRLQMVVSGHGLEDGIAPEAKRALDAFGWLKLC